MQAISDAWKHIRRSPYHSTAAVLTMFLTMLLAGLFLLTTVGSSLILSYFESKPQITVFFAENATAADADSLKKTLEGSGKVSSVTYVSKDEALTIYREQNKDDPLLLEMVTADILPASLEVSAIDPTFLHELEPLINESQAVEEVVFQKDVVDTLLTWTRAIRWVGGAIVGLFALNSLLIVMTVIGMKIALKKEEIEILTLVGATPWFIRAPFFLEGGAYGAIGAAVSWVIIMGLMLWLQPVIMGFLGTIPFIGALFANIMSQTFLLFSLAFFLFMTLAGFTLGGVGSLIALRRYLKF